MDSKLWVGDLEERVLVYDKSVQLSECPHVFLWDPSSGEMQAFIANVVREKIKAQGNRSITEESIEKYKKWFNAEAETWKKEERGYYESRKQDEEEKRQKQLRIERAKAAAQEEVERLARLTPEERHKERLLELGITYLGVRKATPNPARRRVAHCWACKEVLDSSIDIECLSCNWILCGCGACGCGC